MTLKRLPRESASEGNGATPGVAPESIAPERGPGKRRALDPAPQAPQAPATELMTATVVTPDGVASASVPARPGPDRIDGLAARIRSVPPGAPPNLQKELARAARMLPRLRLPSNQDLIDEVEIGIDALMSDPPSLELAKRTNAGVARDLQLRAYTPATRMMVGVAVLSYFFAFGWLLAGGTLLDLDVRNLVGPAVFGWLGSVASMVTRINKFKNVPNPITVGATRPILGSAFGIFTYLLLTSGVISLAGTPSGQFYLAIAFIAGFSERFVPDLISQVEDAVTGSKPATAETETTVSAQVNVT
jgi:hypothetical protein